MPVLILNGDSRAAILDGSRTSGGGWTIQEEVPREYASALAEAKGPMATAGEVFPPTSEICRTGLAIKYFIFLLHFSLIIRNSFFPLHLQSNKSAMKRILFYCLVVLSLTLADSFECSAQRTSNRSVHIGLAQQISAYSIPSGGLDLNAGMYLLHSYWKAGLMATDFNVKAGGINTNGEYFDHAHFIAYGDWMYRLVGTYNRCLNLYLGGGIFMGANVYELFRPVPDTVEKEYPKSEFIYGLKPSVELEIFFCRRVAFILGANFPFTFSSSLETDIAHVVGSFGVRVSL